MKKQSQGKATHFGVFGSTSLSEKDVKKLRDELAETKAQWKELQVVKRMCVCVCVVCVCVKELQVVKRMCVCVSCVCV